MISVLLLAVFACGCAGTTAVTPRMSLKEFAKIFPPAINEADRIVATAQIDLMTAQGHYPVNAALVIQKPSYLRLEMLPVIGTPDFFLTATPENMRIFIPSQGEFYSGKPSAGNLMRFLPWAFNIEDIVMIFSGAYPPLAGEKLSYGSSVENGILRVDMKTSSGLSQIIWVGEDGRIRKFVRNDPDGREIYSVQYEDYPMGTALARRITIKMADQVTSISVKYTDIKIEKATDFSIFELPIPAGIKIIKMD